MERHFGQQLGAEPANAALALGMRKVHLIELLIGQLGDDSGQVLVGVALQVHPGRGGHGPDLGFARPGRGAKGGRRVAHGGPLHGEQNGIAHAGDVHAEVEDSPARQVARQVELGRGQRQEPGAQAVLLGLEQPQALAWLRVSISRR